MNKKSILRTTLITALALSVPLVGMQFSQEVNWNLFDFVIAGILIFATGIIYETATKKYNNKQQRIIISILIGLVFILVWAELAVGLFGTPFAGS